MTDWYVQRTEEVLGPLRPGELLKLVRSGAVKPETKIRKDDSAWFEASQVGGLFEAAMRPTIESHCPGCRQLLDNVPCVCPNCGLDVVVAKTRIIENTISGTDDTAAKPTGPRSVQKWLSKIRKKDENS